MLDQTTESTTRTCYTPSDPEPALSRQGPKPVRALLAVLKKYWGFDRCLPLQENAMTSVLDGRDSVVVLPTGGGKSLCYQAPALVLEGTAIVVSPLISLMKDQVDGLVAGGIGAAFLNSTLGPEQFRDVMEQLHHGKLKLLYVAPERLVLERTLDLLRRLEPSFIAVDEAHCISQWGHDFRPEYRGLGVLKELLPTVAIHAYTATVTERVRRDIVEQLGLHDPRVLVGSFDRPNLVYRVEHRHDATKQIQTVIDRHPGESGIVYCISRADVERTSKALTARGVPALPYHAGLSDEIRHSNQDAFIGDRARVMVATVAFGMGIDKSNVRFVVHAGCPKSLEAYAQESGRAGRDQLAADCTLLYSGADFAVWRNLLASVPAEAQPGALRSLQQLYAYCTRVECRHRALVRHFGQELPAGSCNACDVCLGEVAQLDDPLTVGQKILSGVLRLDQRFGANYTTMVLTGSDHDRLSTYGILASEGRGNVRDWIEQLVGQGFLEKDGEFQVLRLTDQGWKLIRGTATPMLTRPRPTPAGARPDRSGAGPGRDDWEGVDRELFEALRALRRSRADALKVPAYVIFGDVTLRELARVRPSSLESMRQVYGIGDRRLADHGPAFLERIVEVSRERSLPMDVKSGPGSPPVPRTVPVRPASAPPTGIRALVYLRLDRREPLDVIAAALSRAPSTIHGYLCEYIAERKITDPSAWVDPATARSAEEALRQIGTGRLKPVFELLGGRVPYAALRVVQLCMMNR
ncbi:MAG: RecQ family ATP-dependent DNA helicase [Candidatus Riflebacteria bacterium]|nr:RecQ family ATP-dependent DNA helicase [Candidatus Riflebacteria bacterium]